MGDLAEIQAPLKLHAEYESNLKAMGAVSVPSE